jgi:ATP adenylyltransferase
MEKLWSPWRSQYIESFNEGKKKNGCVFCNAINEEILDDASLVIDKGDLTITVLNKFPYNNGHLMVIPKRHLSSFDQLTCEERIEIMDKIEYATKALKLSSNPDGFNIGANIGQVSGAGIADHIHFHIVPRWNGDTNFMPVLGEVKVLSQDLLATKKSLLEAFKKL